MCTACMALDNLVYYYNTYNSNRINSIHMLNEDLEGTEIMSYEYIDVLDMNHQN